MAQWESKRVIRGVEVKVFADEFEYSPEINIDGPASVWAETFDGEPFELTEAEECEIAEEACESRSYDDPYWD
jgi:hypothetical protein